MMRITPVDEGKEDSGSGVKHSPKLEAENPQKTLPFLEVLCKSSGKIRRFSAGTEVGFAVSLINKKLINDGGGNGSSAIYIEAFKEGEEPISFGPSSLLVDYGSDWKLQTVVESHGDKGSYVRAMRKESSKGTDATNSKTTESPFSLLYIGKILLAFLLMFAFGAVFTLALENLPRLILYLNSSV